MIVAGLITGGVWSGGTGLNEIENSMVLWPNPLAQGQDVNIRVSRNSQIQFFNVLGQKITGPVSLPSGERSVLSQALSSGFYLARVSWPGGSETVKLIVR